MVGLVSSTGRTSGSVRWRLRARHETLDRRLAAGGDVMKPIAAPIIGGMITSTVHVLINVPIIFYILKVRALLRGSLEPSVGG